MRFDGVVATIVLPHSPPFFSRIPRFFFLQIPREPTEAPRPQERSIRRISRSPSTSRATCRSNLPSTYLPPSLQLPVLLCGVYVSVDRCLRTSSHRFSDDKRTRAARKRLQSSSHFTSLASRAVFPAPRREVASSVSGSRHRRQFAYELCFKGSDPHLIITCNLIE